MEMAVVFTVLMMAILGLTLACTPEKDEEMLPIEYKMMKSEIMAYGYPRHSTKDTRFPGEDRYVVDFEIRCIFKGAPLSEMIRIVHVGLLDPQCQETDLPKDNPYVVYLRKEGNFFVQTYRRDPGESGYLEEIPSICGSIVAYPYGYTEANSKEQCPAESDYDDDCVQQPTEEPQIETPKKEAPYQPVKTEDGESQKKEKEEKDQKGGMEESDKLQEPNVNGDDNDDDDNGNNGMEEATDDGNDAVVNQACWVCTFALAVFSWLFSFKSKV